MLPIEIIEHVGSFCEDDITQFNWSMTDKHTFENYHYHSVDVISMSRLKMKQKFGQERFTRAKLRPMKLGHDHLVNTLKEFGIAGYQIPNHPKKIKERENSDQEIPSGAILPSMELEINHLKDTSRLSSARYSNICYPGKIKEESGQEIFPRVKKRQTMLETNHLEETLRLSSARYSNICYPGKIKDESGQEIFPKVKKRQTILETNHLEETLRGINSIGVHVTNYPGKTFADFFHVPFSL